MATKPTNLQREKARTERALTTIEVAERLAVHAYVAIENGDATEALRLLDALTGATTSTTASLVKSQALSDKISAAARAHVGALDPFQQAAS